MLRRSLCTIEIFSIFLISFIKADEICKVGLVSGQTNYTAEKFPSPATIVNSHNGSFICRASIISKNQVLTGLNCLPDINKYGKWDTNDYRIMFKEFDQNDSIELSVNEIFVPTYSDREPTVAIFITKKKIPFKYFIYTTCFRSYLEGAKEKITMIKKTDPCKLMADGKISQGGNKYAEIPFDTGNGAFYMINQNNWSFLGFYSKDVINSKKCDTKVFQSFQDLNKISRCELLGKSSITTVIGSNASESYCSGDLIFDEQFDLFSNSTGWKHENTLSGGGNWEFQWYVPDAENSFVENGILHIRPTFTADKFNERFLTKGTARIPEKDCTNKLFYGCKREGKYNLINPIRSASISTVDSFAFKYGVVEVRAKVAAGNWLASTISLYPKEKFYGEWPYSGEIDIMESRGNRKFLDDGDADIGVKQVGHTLHFGARFEENHWDSRHNEGFHKDFHVYKMNWTSEMITFYIDGVAVDSLKVKEGLYEDFKLKENNPWLNGGKFAPFDKEFYISISLKVGGTVFFPDNDKDVNKKPWRNDAEHASEDFWNGKEDWIETWKKDELDFQIDYVKVYAL